MVKGHGGQGVLQITKNLDQVRSVVEMLCSSIVTTTLFNACYNCIKFALLLTYLCFLDYWLCLRSQGRRYGRQLNLTSLKDKDETSKRDFSSLSATQVCVNPFFKVNLNEYDSYRSIEVNILTT